MPKSKVIRNEAEHKVRLHEGSDVASSHEPQARGPSDRAAGAGAHTASALVKSRSEQRVKLPSADDAVVRPRVKLRRAAAVVPVVEPVLETRTPPAVVRPPLPTPGYKPLHASAPQPNLPEAPAPLPKPEALWKPGSFVLQRMSSLRSRNAKVQDQIQRLRRPYGSEGK